MTGNTDNVTAWADADVFLGSLLAPNPDDGDPFALNEPARSVSVTTTSGSTAITSSALFSSADVGATITGAGIPAGAHISAVASSSAATISAAATAGATVSAAIGASTQGWDLAGLLDGSAGSAEDQSWTNTPYYAWGQGEIGATNKNLAITRTFTAMEIDRPAIMAMRYDTSGVTFDENGGYTGELGARNLADRWKLGFDLRSNGVTKRRITKNYAQISALGTVTENEDAPPTLLVTAKIYPDISSGRPVYWVASQGASA